MSRTKRIFISDLHMGDNKSLQPNPPDYDYSYGWLYDKRLDMLSDFLNIVNDYYDVKELVILGDFLDQWVCPAKLTPADFASIIDKEQSPKNAKVIEAFKAIDSNPEIDLVYVPGNHDMLLSEAVLKVQFPNIKYIGQNDVGVYRQGNIAAEHGSQYTLFCAPDPGSPLDQNLPIGFYISRAAAEKSAHQNLSVDPFDVLLKFIPDFINDLEKGKASAMKSLYEAIAQDCDLHSHSLIQMKGLQGIDSISVDNIAEKYSNLWSRWKEVHPNGVKVQQALLNEILELKDVAERQYFFDNRARIVVFGHTHKSCLYGYSYVDGHLTYAHSRECDYLYANSGTWINSCRKCTYVEVESVDNVDHVRLCQYKSHNEPRHIIEDMHLKKE